MEETLIQLGYIGLFTASFLAATLLPLSSEIFVILMIVSGRNAVLIWFVALMGNYLGASTNYLVGKYGDDFILSKYIKYGPKKKKVEDLYKKYGSPLLLFSWLPVIGDPLCLIPGIFHLDFHIFSFWVILGKAIRYFVVIKAVEIIAF